MEPPNRSHHSSLSITIRLAHSKLPLTRLRPNPVHSIRHSSPLWTVATWLNHWVENIAAPTVVENTADGYRVAIRTHLIPGVGAHRLEKLRPEHLEKLYAKMQERGSAAGTAHQAHRTMRTALNVAMRHCPKDKALHSALGRFDATISMV